MPLLSLILILGSLGGPLNDTDTDADGLSDFQERHKYFTNPAAADSDGDGVPDGDWNERREYAYTVRAVIQVAPPVTRDVLCDDYQDARILEEMEDYVELEVILYPLNTVAQAFTANPNWRGGADSAPDGTGIPLVAAEMREWTRPGLTANWDDGLRDRILAKLKADGIDPATLDDRTFVQRAARRLLQHAEYVDGFTTFCSQFVDGKARIYPGMEETARNGQAEKSLTLEEQWERELFAKGMFDHGTRGSCTSSAIYLNGCLRALGVPTRIVLAIPIIDANDERERALLQRLRHHEVRRTVLEGTQNLVGSWSSHTFNEVFIGGRWRRLNYDRLGQNILDSQFFGLMVHVATFSDWADGNMAATWGMRQAHWQQRPNDPFGGPNPYSTISLSDRFGQYAKLENPAPADERAKPDTNRAAPVAADKVPAEFVLDQLIWSDAPDSPTGPLPWPQPVLLARAGKKEDFDTLKRFTQSADLRFFLEADGQPLLKVSAGVGGVTTRESSYLIIQLGPADWQMFVPGAKYQLRAQNANENQRWKLSEPLSAKR